MTDTQEATKPKRKRASGKRKVSKRRVTHRRKPTPMAIMTRSAAARLIADVYLDGFLSALRDNARAPSMSELAVYAVKRIREL